MKLLIIITALTLRSSAPVQAAWFGSADALETLRIDSQRALDAERQHTTHWQIAACGFAFSGAVWLIIGTALGSRTRRHGTLA
jgi:hypothetical protein